MQPAQIPVEVPPPPTRAFWITKLAFRYRLSDAEYLGLLQAAKTNNAVAAWLETYNLASVVDLADRRIIPAFEYLKEVGVFSEERVIEIVSKPIQDEERPS